MFSPWKTNLERKKKKKKKKDAIIKRWCKDHHGESTTPRHLQKHSPFSFFFLFQETVARIIGAKTLQNLTQEDSVFQAKFMGS